MIESVLPTMTTVAIKATEAVFIATSAIAGPRSLAIVNARNQAEFGRSREAGVSSRKLSQPLPRRSPVVNARIRSRESLLVDCLVSGHHPGAIVAAFKLGPPVRAELPTSGLVIGECENSCRVEVQVSRGAQSPCMTV